MNFDLSVTWAALGNVLVALLPLLVFAVALTVVVYATIVSIAPRTARPGAAPIKVPAGEEAGAVPNIPSSDTSLGLGTMSGLSYILMSALFGIIVGMLTNQLGGLEALLKSPTEGSFLKGIASTLVLALAVVGGLFLDPSQNEMRRPIGVVAFLMCFLVSGLYWSTLHTV